MGKKGKSPSLEMLDEEMIESIIELEQKTQNQVIIISTMLYKPK